MIKFTIGADPEFFLKDTETRAFVSAHDKVPGTKHKPVKLPDGSAIQADGTAVEFNIEPAETAEEFSDKIFSAINEIRKIVPTRYEFCYQPYVTYSSPVWKEIPDSAKELGCDPDWSAISFSEGQQNTVVNPGQTRTGSGHIHLGWTKDQSTKHDTVHFKDAVLFAACLEKTFGSVLTKLDPLVGVRERYYGLPGSFRCKPYGMEYRRLSNAWLSDKKKHIFVAKAALQTAQQIAQGKPVVLSPYGYYGLNRGFEEFPALTW